MTKYTEWHRRRVAAAYRRTGSIRLAARAVGASLSWTFGVLDAAGLISRRTPVYPVRLIREAEQLYVQERLSCRGVAARLAQTYSPSPSQEWVHQRMKERGLLRTKAQADRIQNGRRHGKDYENLLPARARELAERGWSVRRIADALGISRNAVRAYLDPADRCSPAEATVRRMWLTDDLESVTRRETRSLVLELRVEGKKYREISERTGLSTATISAYLREAGLTRANRPVAQGRRQRLSLEEVKARECSEGG